MPNRTLPEFLKDDVALSSLTRDAEWLFYKLHHLVDDAYRFPIIPSLSAPKNLKGSLFSLRDGVRCTDVARWLDELQRSGAILVRDSERGLYGEIPDRLRYHRGDYKMRVPKYGPRDVIPAQQAFLPLGPVSEVPRVPKEDERFKGNDSEYVIGHDHDSSERVAADARAGESGNRNGEKQEGGEASRFAREPEVVMRTKLGRRLGRFLGMSQMVIECRESGARWIKLLEQRSGDIEALLEQGERIAITDLPNGQAKAKWLTRRLHDIAA